MLSTGPIERVSVLDKLIANGGELNTRQITGALEIAKSTALKTMTELTLLGLVEMTPRLGTEELAEEIGQNNDPKKIRLKDSFLSWLKTEEFKKLRQGFESAPASDEAVEGDGGGLE